MNQSLCKHFPGWKLSKQKPKFVAKKSCCFHIFPYSFNFRIEAIYPAGDLFDLADCQLK